MSTLPVTDRTRIRRLPERGTYDRDQIYAIVDAALICHVGTLRDGVPVVMPTACWRVDDHLYIHGAPASRTLKSAQAQHDICVTITHVDGLVLARSAFHHSINYRCVVIYGQAEVVPDDEKMAALEAFLHHVMPGRWGQVRQPNDTELRGTRVLRLALTEASAKVRVGPPKDDAEDYALPVWAGVLPLSVQAGAPVADPRLDPGVPVPPEVLSPRR